MNSITARKILQYILRINQLVRIGYAIVLWKTVCLGRAVAAIRPLLFMCVSQILGQMQTENTFFAYGLTWNEKLVRIVQ
jgi:hypothetical protein